jgi:hypothetical protein
MSGHEVACPLRLSAVASPQNIDQSYERIRSTEHS